MKEVLSLFTFIGALCFVVFVTVFEPTAVSAVAGASNLPTNPVIEPVSDS
jgi:hypothetical protein